MSTQLATTPHRSIIADMAQRFGMERTAFEATLKKTIMPADREATNEQVAAFLVVASQYDLNPFTKEIYAFPSRAGGIQPVVSIDGWLKIINSHPSFNGMKFDDQLDDKGGLIAVTCRMYRKDREHPTEVTEYMSECRQDNKDTWKKWPARMLRHKATIQAARYAFGFSGIVDPDEADRIIEAEPVAVIERPRAKSETSGAAPAKEAAKPEAETPLKVESTPPGGNMIDLIKAKLDAGALSESDLFKKFGVEKWSDLQTSQLDAIIGWIKNPC